MEPEGEPEGPAGGAARGGAQGVLERLAQVLEARKGADPERSYVASLYARGLDAVLRKVGEEALEVILAARDGDREALVREVADLWFHSLVLLAREGLGPGEVLAELERRFGLSGLEEKARRGRSGRGPQAAAGRDPGQGLE